MNHYQKWPTTKKLILIISILVICIFIVGSISSKSLKPKIIKTKNLKPTFQVQKAITPKSKVIKQVFNSLENDITWLGRTKYRKIIRK